MTDRPTTASSLAMERYLRELEVATEAARGAGAAIRDVYGQDHVVAYKVGDDPLTVADSAADRRIRERIRQAFPGDGWLSEESDARPGSDTGRMWVVDPLDGTREFVEGIPEFAVSIALTVDGIPMVAVVYHPIRDVLVAAVRGGGATLDGRPIRVSEASDLATAVVLASRSEVKRGEWAPFQSRCLVRPTGSVAYKMALVAIGEADATVSLAPKHGWDICAGVLLVEEAGGRVSLLDGDGLDLSRPAALLDGLIADNGALHDQLVSVVAAVAAEAAGAAEAASAP